MTEESQTADKALLILQLIADSRSISLLHIADTLGMKRTTAQRIVATLALRGWITKAGNEFSIAPRLRRLADNAFPVLHAAMDSFAAALRDLLEDHHITLLSSTYDHGDSIVVTEHPPSTDVDLRARLAPGTRTPLIESAGGIAIVASFEGPQRERALSLALQHAHNRREAVETAIEDTVCSGFSLRTDSPRIGASELSTPLSKLIYMRPHFTAGTRSASLSLIHPGASNDVLLEAYHELTAAASRLR